ncbi:MAG TPA: CorA family divalent cation transporter [Propionibacteriaceae bacterium]|nr:CorA family divalent cation transporter [Propionibacteriaceae bacterium]
MAARCGWTSTTPMRTAWSCSVSWLMSGRAISRSATTGLRCRRCASTPTHRFSAINGLARGSDGRLYFQPLRVFLTPRALVTVLGPTSPSLTSEIARRELTAVRQRLDSGQLRPANSFELVAAIRAETIRTHEDLIAESSARIAQLERDVSQKDPVKAEALLQDLFDLRHDLEAIRTSAAQAAESFANLIETMDLQEGLMQTDLRRVRKHAAGLPSPAAHG